MTCIETYDNDLQGKVIDPTSKVYEDISYIADTPIKELNDRDNLLIFPQCLGDFGDDIGDACICSFHNYKGQQFLTTGNVMGFVGCGDTQLKISSRFDQSSNGDYFMLYMLEKVFSINLFNLRFGSNPEAVFDFLMYLFPHYLNRALQQGVYKEYQTHSLNNERLKGAVDVARHLRENYPFLGSIAYSVREHTHDNNLTELVRHTIEYILSKEEGESILNHNRETRENVSVIIKSTSSYSRKMRNTIINRNCRPKVHPYYSEYAPLQQLCLQILRGENLRYGENPNQIFGILFDGAWLWEEYLATMLTPLGYRHPENKRGVGYINLFTSGGARYPDFYHPEHHIVLDAKYKNGERKSSVSQFDRNDLHQIISYLHVLQYDKAGFLVPATRQIDIPSKELMGYGGQIAVYCILIPQNEQSYKSFVQRMAAEETNFMNQIKNILYVLPS